MEAISRIAVLGAGPGALSTAATLTHRGYRVTLFNRTAERLAAVRERGGVEIEGDLGAAFVPLPVVTTDPAAALQDAQLILIAVPAYGQVPLAELARPFLRDDTILLLLTGSCGSLEVAEHYRRARVDLVNGVLLGETVTLPQSARVVGPAKLRIKLPSQLRVGTFPGKRCDELLARVGDILRLLPQRNVLGPGLHNPNFLIHPAPMLLNYAAIERADGVFSIMNEGMTPGVLRCLDAVDAEKLALCRALGIEGIDIDSLYHETGSGPHVYRQPGEPFGLHDRIWARYITEDVPYGTVLFSSLGRLIDVPTPVSDGINTLLSVADQADYWATGRTVDKLGLSGLTTERILAYLDTGERQ